MKRLLTTASVCAATVALAAGPAGAFSTKNIAPIRGIPVAAQNADSGKPGVWATNGVYTHCGAIGVDAVFYNSSANPHVDIGQQTYSIEIEIKIKNAWVHVAGSEVKSYRPNHQHRRYEYDQYINVGWHYTYRVLVTNHTSAPLLGTMWVNAAANDNNAADHDVADCK